MELSSWLYMCGAPQGDGVSPTLFAQLIDISDIDQKSFDVVYRPISFIVYL